MDPMLQAFGCSIKTTTANHSGNFPLSVCKLAVDSCKSLVVANIPPFYMSPKVMALDNILNINGI